MVPCAWTEPVTDRFPPTVSPVFRNELPYTFDKAAVVGTLDILADVQEFITRFDPFDNK
jgi:hypothetical protein